MGKPKIVGKNFLEMLFIIPVILLLFTAMASASQWAKTYGGSSHDLLYSMHLTSDGGCIVAGSTYSFGAEDWDAWILKLDGNGNIVWQKTYGDTGNNGANDIQQTTDGGYIVTGSLATNSPLMLKLDSYGNVQWQKTYSNGSFGAVQQTSDGGYITTGVIEYVIGYSDIWIVKLDVNGNAQWQKAYGSSGFDNARTIQQTSDGGYIVIADTKSIGEIDWDAWILKLDSNGNATWQKSYGGTNTDVAIIQQTADGGYVMTGSTSSFGAGGSDIWILKLNGNGEIVWETAYGGTNDDEALSIQQTSDGGYIVAGCSNSFGAGDWDSWILKLDTNGNVDWQKTYNMSNSEFPMSIQQTVDGGYIVEGYMLDSSGYFDFFLLKLDSNGDIPDCPIIGTSNALVTDTDATINDTTVTGIDTAVSPQTSITTLLNTNATVTEICYSGPQNVNVLSPNGSEIIPSGSTYSIRWSAPPEAVKFKLRYSINNGSTWKLIAKNVTGTSYNWTVPILNNNKNQCLVNVIGFNASGTKVGEDVSDSTFTIEVVKVSSPDGGEILTSGTSNTITWQTNGTIRPVAQAKLSYSRNGGTSWTAIKTLSGNPGSYNWIVPNVSSSSCKVKVVLKDAGGVTVGNDISDGVFTIQP